MRNPQHWFHMQITVRRATPQDIDWLMPQLKAFSHFYGTKKSLYGDGVYAREAFLGLIENHFVMIAESEGAGLLGFIAGVLSQHFFNPEIVQFSELFWWVAEEHRGTRAGLLLLNSFVEFGKEHADWITFSLESKSPVSERALIRRGFQPHERQFLLEVI